MHLGNLSEVALTMARVITSWRTEMQVDFSSGWDEEGHPRHLALGQLWSCNPFSGSELLPWVTCLPWWHSGQVRVSAVAFRVAVRDWHLPSAWDDAALCSLRLRKSTEFWVTVVWCPYGNSSPWQQQCKKHFAHACTHTLWISSAQT